MRSGHDHNWRGCRWLRRSGCGSPLFHFSHRSCTPQLSRLLCSLFNLSTLYFVSHENLAQSQPKKNSMGKVFAADEETVHEKFFNFNRWFDFCAFRQSVILHACMSMECVMAREIYDRLWRNSRNIASLKFIRKNGEFYRKWWKGFAMLRGKLISFKFDCFSELEA